MTDYLALALAQEEAETAEEQRQEEARKRSAGLAGRAGPALVRLAARKQAETGAPRPTEPEKTGGTLPGAVLETRAEEKPEPAAEEPGQEADPAEGADPERASTAEDAVRRLSRAAAAAENVRFGKETGARAAAALLEGLRRAQAAAGLAQRPGRRILVTLPGTGESASGWGPEALDRAVERDARRYDGGFALY